VTVVSYSTTPATRDFEKWDGKTKFRDDTPKRRKQNPATEIGSSTATEIGSIRTPSRWPSRARGATETGSICSGTEVLPKSVAYLGHHSLSPLRAPPEAKQAKPVRYAVSPDLLTEHHGQGSRRYELSTEPWAMREWSTPTR